MFCWRKLTDDAIVILENLQGSPPPSRTVERDRGDDASLNYLFPCQFAPASNGPVGYFPDVAVSSQSARYAWLDAVQHLLSSRGGSSFSVFIPVPSAAFLLDAGRSVPLLVRELQSRFSTLSTTWVTNIPANHSALAASDWCDNMIWTHWSLDNHRLDSVSLTPYIFDFMLLPESYTTALQREGLQRLASLLTMAKVTIVVPEGLEFARTQPPRLPVAPASMADFAPPWVLNMTMRMTVLPQRVSVISLESLIRHTLHEFKEVGNAHPRTYRLHFSAASSWTPTLAVWRKLHDVYGPVRDPRRGAALDPTTVYPVVSSTNPAGEASVSDGLYVPHARRKPIALTDLAMVNLKLVLGLGPSLATRLKLWSMIMEMPLFEDCALCNVCARGRTTVWCDQHVKPGDLVRYEDQLVRTARTPNGRKCRLWFQKILYVKNQ